MEEMRLQRHRPTSIGSSSISTAAADRRRGRLRPLLTSVMCVSRTETGPFQSSGRKGRSMICMVPRCARRDSGKGMRGRSEIMCGRPRRQAQRPARQVGGGAGGGVCASGTAASQQRACSSRAAALDLEPGLGLRLRWAQSSQRHTPTGLYGTLVGTLEPSGWHAHMVHGHAVARARYYSVKNENL